MKKLTLIVSSLGGGGAERVLSQLANHWSRMGIEVSVVTLNSPDEPDVYPLNPAVNRQYVPMKASSSTFGALLNIFHAVKTLRSLLRSSSTDVVLSFITSTNVLAILATRGLGVRTVVSERTDPALHSLPFIWRFFRKVIYRWADLVVAQTPRVQLWLQRECRARVTVIPNGIDSRLRLGHPYNQGCIASAVVAVGRLHHEKGFDILIHAFSIVLRKHPAWKLMILGEGDERSKLQALIDGMGINHAIELKGFVRNPHALMAQADIAVQPSRYEGFPNALLEAMSLGLPVLATDTAGAMLVTDDVNGLLVPSEDPEKMAAALVSLIESEELRRRLGIEAEKVKIRYSNEAIFQLWEAALNIPRKSA